MSFNKTLKRKHWMHIYNELTAGVYLFKMAAANLQ